MCSESGSLSKISGLNPVTFSGLGGVTLGPKKFGSLDVLKKKLFDFLLNWARCEKWIKSGEFSVC